MKILVLSDSHSALSFMRQCIEKLKPDCVIHLGDHYDDGQAMAEEYPQLLMYQVPGNCDKYRCPPFVQEMLVKRIGGVEFYMTHGHRHCSCRMPGQVKRLRCCMDIPMCQTAIRNLTDCGS